MLYSINDLAGYEIAATDGNIGHVRGFYFDPDSWKLHYLLVDTRGEWLPGRKVLISLVALGELDAKNKSLPISLSKEEIRDSPPIDKDAPITSLRDLNAYYGWQFSLGGDTATSGLELTEAAVAPGEDLELRSTHEVIGFQVEVQDGDIGHVEDFIIDYGIWMVRYMVIDTRNRWPGKKVLVSPEWIDQVGWQDKKIYVAASLDAIGNFPDYDPSSLAKMITISKISLMTAEQVVDMMPEVSHILFQMSLGTLRIEKLITPSESEGTLTIYSGVAGEVKQAINLESELVETLVGLGLIKEGKSVKEGLDTVSFYSVTSEGQKMAARIGPALEQQRERREASFRGLE
ncbi:MAG: PRC-barrel domain-containing protein [Desulfomonilaceae bacterium]